MADLLSVPDEDQQNYVNAEVASQDNLEKVADDITSQQLLENKKEDERMKLDKELKQLEQIKKEEEAKAKNEQERQAKLQKKENEKLGKLRKEEEAKAKKEKEKQKKLAEVKAKKEEERKAQLQNQEKEKLEKLNKQKDLQATKQIQIAEKQAKDELQFEDTDNNEKETEISDDIHHQESDTNTNLNPTESVIKRGVPKNTKPAPAVVAIKMADLLSVPDEQVNEEKQNDNNAEITSQDNLEKLADDITGQQLLDIKKEDEKTKLEKDLKEQMQLKKDEDAKAKKEQEKL